MGSIDSCGYRFHPLQQELVVSCWSILWPFCRAPRPEPSSSVLSCLNAPETSRTSDLWFRRPTLYPAELQARAEDSTTCGNGLDRKLSAVPAAKMSATVSSFFAACLRSDGLTISYRSKIAHVLWPVSVIATRSGIPCRARFRTTVLGKSCGIDSASGICKEGPRCAGKPCLFSQYLDSAVTSYRVFFEELAGYLSVDKRNNTSRKEKIKWRPKNRTSW